MFTEKLPSDHAYTVQSVLLIRRIHQPCWFFRVRSMLPATLVTKPAMPTSSPVNGVTCP